MTICYPTPYQDKTSPYASKLSPFSDKVSPYSQKDFCIDTDFNYLLLETGDFILQENGDRIIL